MTEVLPQLFDNQAMALQLAKSAGRSETEEALFLAALATGLLAKAHHDLGDGITASRLAVASFEMAIRSGDSELRGWCACLAGFVSYWHGNPNEALRFGVSADQAWGSSSTSTSLWIRATLARTAASLGLASKSEALIAQLDEAGRNTKPGSLSEFGGLVDFASPRLEYYIADALSQLDGRIELAGERADNALQMYQDGPTDQASFSDETGSRLIVIQRSIVLGEYSEAEAQLSVISELESDKLIFGIRRLASRVVAGIESSDPEGRRRIELLDEISRIVAPPAGPPGSTPTMA